MKKLLQNALLLAATFALLICAGCGEDRTVLLTVSDGDFQISNSQGKTLTYDGGFSGEMKLISQYYLAEAREDRTGEYTLEVPYSETFTYQGEPGERRSFSVFVSSDQRSWEYAVSGTGLEEVVLSLTGEITLTGSDMEFQLFLSLPCTGLGKHGCVRLRGWGGDKVTVKATESGIEFSGLAPEGAWLSYAGAVENPYVDLDLEVGNGTLDFSQIAEGVITVTEDGCEVRSIKG